MKKLNNKGFSLVELIIVIAIMAILVGVVGTQVIPYLENSRKAKDQQIISGWNTAGVSAYSMEAGNLDPTKTYTIEYDNATDIFSIKVDGTATTTDTKALKLLGVFDELVNADKSNNKLTVDWASKAGTYIDKVDIEINGADGTVTTTTSIVSAQASKYSFDEISNE